MADAKLLSSIPAGVAWSSVHIREAKRALPRSRGVSRAEMTHQAPSSSGKQLDTQEALDATAEACSVWMLDNTSNSPYLQVRVDPFSESILKRKKPSAPTPWASIH